VRRGMHQEGAAVSEPGDTCQAAEAAANRPRAGFPRAAWVLAAMARTDAAGAAVRDAFEQVGIEHVVIKGRAFADRLYHGAAERPYGDTDIVIRVGDRDRAKRVLETLEYRRTDRDGDLLGVPGYSNTYVDVNGAVIDLHWNLSGITAPPETTWEFLREHSTEMSLGGRSARVPDDAATALIVVLHNAHHAARWRTAKRDLDRAASVLALKAWRSAQAQARRLGAEEAFAAGLALSESGRELARRLDVDGSVSLEYRLRADAVHYRTWAIHRISTTPRAGRARVIAEVLMPAPASMRRFFPLARRGPLGLALAYLLRPARLATSALPSLAEYLRARGAR
jgi:hypothetical protein